MVLNITQTYYYVWLFMYYYYVRKTFMVKNCFFKTCNHLSIQFMFTVPELYIKSQDS